jgi:hypothetical protein
MDSGLFAQKVAADLRAARQLGVGVAPTFFVNGIYLKGPQTFAALAAVIDRELGRPARPAPSRSSGHSPPDESAPLEAQPSELPRLPPDLVIEPEAVLTLRRGEISRALRDRPSLERRLRTSTGRYGGRRLLKLSEVQPGDLFDRLGLHARDVLLVVDGEWVTDEHNPLWQHLEERGEVTLVFMRRGLPQTLRYVIE